MKLKAKKSTIGTHKVVVYCPMIDWKIKKIGLNYKWDVCDALVVSRPCYYTKSCNKIHALLKLKRLRIQYVSEKKMNILV